MTAVEVLAACDAKHIRLVVVGDHLQYRAPRGAVTDALREAVARHRADIVEMVRARIAVAHEAPAAWPEPWRERFEERAAILEFDAGLTRKNAETTAAVQVRAAFAKGTLS